MPLHPVTKAAILMAIIVVAVVASWEIYLRNSDVKIAYDEGAALWADKRARVFAPSDQATVFIGSSRIKFDLDTDTWKSLTGDEPVMLAIEGSTPRPLLDDLANDPEFRGKLVIDITEPLFFSNAPPNLFQPNTNIKYYHDRTPAQKAGFAINRRLESNLVFLDKDYFSMNAMLDQANVKSRPGVFIFPDFPLGFKRTEFSRQNKMSDEFLADTNLQNQVKGVWDFVRKVSRDPPLDGERLEAMLQSIKSATDKIKARGGQIIFVRTPSSNPMRKGEEMGFPRNKYWDRILEITGCQGIHFADYPSIDHFICPEFSHLTPSDAIVFTKEFVKILHGEKGWKFNKLPATISYTH